MGRPSIARARVPHGVRKSILKCQRKSSTRQIGSKKAKKDVSRPQTLGIPKTAKPVKLSPRCTTFQRSLRNYRTPEKSDKRGPVSPTEPKEFRFSYNLRSRHVVAPPRSPQLTVSSSYAMLKASPTVLRFAQTLRAYPAKK